MKRKTLNGAVSFDETLSFDDREWREQWSARRSGEKVYVKDSSYDLVKRDQERYLLNRLSEYLSTFPQCLRGVISRTGGEK